MTRNKDIEVRILQGTYGSHDTDHPAPRALSRRLDRGNGTYNGESGIRFAYGLQRNLRGRIAGNDNGLGCVTPNYLRYQPNDNVPERFTRFCSVGEASPVGDIDEGFRGKESTCGR